MARGERATADELRADLNLVRRMLDGDEEAFEQFFADYLGGLFRFAMSRLEGDEELAQDIVQSTVLAAIESLDRYRGDAALMSWLCGICRFQISGHFRRLDRSPVQVDLSEEIPEVRAVLATLSGGPESPDKHLHSKEVVSLVHLTLDQLPSRYGKALEWKYFEGLSVKEIAERMKVGPKAAESVMSRAREAFRGAFAAISKGFSEGRGEGNLRLVPVRRS